MKLNEIPVAIYDDIEEGFVDGNISLRDCFHNLLEYHANSNIERYHLFNDRTGDETIGSAAVQNIDRYVSSMPFGSDGTKSYISKNLTEHKFVTALFGTTMEPGEC